MSPEVFIFLIKKITKAKQSSGRVVVKSVGKNNKKCPNCSYVYQVQIQLVLK